MVQDGQKIYIPSLNDKEEKQIITPEISGGGSNESSNESIKVNINTATQTQLEQLPGVGPSIAGSIIEYRTENGKFKNIDELKKVSGIGEAKFNKIKDKIIL